MKKALADQISMQATKCNDTQKPPVLHDLESILYTYMQFNMNRKINLTQSVICLKAREIFKFLSMRRINFIFLMALEQRKIPLYPG